MSFPRTRESIILKEELGGFKDPKDLLQLLELTILNPHKIEEEEYIKIFSNRIFTYRINIAEILDYAHNRKIKNQILNMIDL